MSKENLKERDEKIFKCCECGMSLLEVAACFDLTPSGVEEIYNNQKKQRGTLEDMPPLQKMLSTRTQTCLVGFFGEDIFADPERIVDFGVMNLIKIKNIGKKSLTEVSKALHFLGYIPVDEAKMMLTDWRKDLSPMKASRPRKTKKKLPPKIIAQKPHLGDLILMRYPERLLSGLEDLKRFDLIDQLKKPVLSFTFHGNKKIILEMHHFLATFPYSFIILTNLGYDIWSLPDQPNRNASVYVSRFPNLIRYIKDNEKNISVDLWGLLYGYPLDEIFDFVYRRDWNQ